MNGNLQMNRFKITGLPTDIDDSDAISYSVFNELLNNGLMNRVSKDGDEISGDLVLKIAGNSSRLLACKDLNNQTGFNFVFGIISESNSVRKTGWKTTSG